MSTRTGNGKAISTHQGDDACSMSVAKVLGDGVCPHPIVKKGLEFLSSWRGTITLRLLQAIPLQVAIERNLREAHFFGSLTMSQSCIEQRFHLVTVGHRDVVRPSGAIELAFVLKESVERFLLVGNRTTDLARQEMQVIQSSNDEMVDVLTSILPKALRSDAISQTKQRQTSPSLIDNRHFGIRNRYVPRPGLTPNMPFAVNDCAEVADSIRAFIHTQILPRTRALLVLEFTMTAV